MKTSIELELLAELRAALADLEVSSEVRANVAGLAVDVGVTGVTIWVFVSSGATYFSWHFAEKQHPLHDIAGTARRIADDVRAHQGVRVHE